MGDVIVDENDQVLAKSVNSTQMLGSSKEPGAPKKGESIPFRVCDELAQNMNGLQGAPNFKPYWSTKKKDLAIKELQAYLAAIGPKAESILRQSHWIIED